ncbi:MAG: hypothetical protein ACRD1W_17160, partial [Vicinamibacterales bacterium]
LGIACTTRTSASSRLAAAFADGAVERPAGELVVTAADLVSACWHATPLISSNAIKSRGEVA